MMVSPVDRINALDIEIADLDVKNKVVFSSETQMYSDELHDEMRAREVELRARLDGPTVSAQPATDDSGVHDQQTCPFISSLPYDVLSAVFKEGQMDTTFALSVSQVSQHWRDIALQTPFLWSEIQLFPWRTGGGYLKYLNLLIQRSRSHPLDIKITLYEWDNPGSFVNRLAKAFGRSKFKSPLDMQMRLVVNHCLQAQLDIIISEVSRWRSINYSCDSSSEVLEITERFAHLSVPTLVSFDLRVMQDNGRRANEPLCIFNGGAPMLSHVCIGGLQPFKCLPPLPFVTTLRFNETTSLIRGTEFLHILRSSPALVSLHIDERVVSVNALYRLALQGEHVEMATLRSFSFSANASPKYVIESILNTIRCPALESLAISSLEIQVDGLSDTLTLPLPSFPMLQSITLDGIQCAQFVYNFNFAHLPTLHTISLTNCVSPLVLLHPTTLAPGRDGSNIAWPALRVIELSHLGAKEFDGLCGIIWYRRECRQPIEAVVLDPISLQRFPEKVEWMKQHVAVKHGRDVHYYLEPHSPTASQHNT